jgi:hypothetical protein
VVKQRTAHLNWFATFARVSGELSSTSSEAAHEKRT